MNDKGNPVRDITSLSFLVIRRGQGSRARYLLQCNKHLDGENFLGGHVDKGETPLQAVLRELKEETGLKEENGKNELLDRWGISIDGEVPEAEWEAIAKDVVPVIASDAAACFRLPSLIWKNSTPKAE